MNMMPNLGSRCGTSIDQDALEFSASKSNLIYLDKVFSYNKGESCPILLPLTTTAETYTATLNVTENSGCCCNSCGADCSSTFTVNNAVVLVEQVLLTGTISPEDVTVNGITVDDITTENGQYVAATANLISQIQRTCCTDFGLPTKTFFLASNIGPWSIRIRIILEGVISTNGRNSCFRAEFTNATGTFQALPATSTSNFAISKLSLPCSVNNTAPTIRFQFGAKAQILNPVLTLTTPAAEEPCTALASNLVLNGTLVISPTISTEVVRKSLFCITACEAMLPCDGTFAALTAAQADEDDTTNPFAPDCSCGQNHTPIPVPSNNGGCCQNTAVSNNGGCGEAATDCHGVASTNENSGCCGSNMTHCNSCMHL